MNTLIVAILAVILIVYISTSKSDVYADKIIISICKVLNFEISNKVKCSGSVEKNPEQSEHQ